MGQRPPATRRHDRVADSGLVEKLSATAGDRDHHQVADVPEPEIDTQFAGSTRAWPTAGAASTVAGSPRSRDTRDFGETGLSNVSIGPLGRTLAEKETSRTAASGLAAMPPPGLTAVPRLQQAPGDAPAPDRPWTDRPKRRPAHSRCGGAAYGGAKPSRKKARLSVSICRPIVQAMSRAWGGSSR